MKRKVKIEVENADGVKIKIEVPEYDPDKIYAYLRALEMADGYKDFHEIHLSNDEGSQLVIDKVFNLIKQEFGLGLFSLNDIYKAYTIKYGEDISKSTLATYLSRFVSEGRLERIGRRGRYSYRIKDIGSIEAYFK